MKVISWNLAGRTNRAAEQVQALGARQPDIVALQEVTARTSVIVGATRVTKSVKRCRELARLAWRRNAEHEVVTFAFDRRDRLVGQIRHPAEHLDSEELELYVTTLARECDRFEYLLSGSDAF